MSQCLLHKSFAAHSEQLAQLRSWVRDSAKQAALDSDRIEKVIIGVNEACMNIIRHAYKQQPGEIIFDAILEPGQLVFQLTDFAPTVDCSCIKSRELDDLRPGGLGVHFIKEVMDAVEYLPGPDGMGNIIRMTVNTN